ncbi:MAG TPA: type IV pilus assembly protein PilM, partial [Candidatus Brocadiia bacterium]|nr:type IV pilus assembly protein PilM [Candidatus Brocadiia bacterium]
MMLGTGGSVWGLDLGDSALKAVKMARAGAKLAIQDFQVIRYRELAGENKSRKKEDLVFQALMEFFRKPDRQRTRFVASIPSQSFFSRFIGLPPVQKNRVAEIVRYEARQQIPFDLSEVIWDYQLVRPDFMPGEEIEIGLFAVKKDVVNSFLNQFVMAQDWLESIQIAPLALYNFVRYDGQAEKPTVVIDIGSQSTDLLIVQDTKFWLRNLPIAGNSFNAILEKKFNISADEAENVKVNLAQSKHRRTVFEVLKPALKDLVAEIQRSVGYYKSLAGDVKFDEVLLMGEGFKLYGLHKFLSDQLQYRVRPLTEVRDIAYAGKADREEEFKTHLPGLAVAIGLGLQGMRAGEVTVDLMPEEFVLRRELKRKRGPAALAVGLLWMSVLVLFLGAKMSVWSIENFRFQRMETKPDGTRGQVTVDQEGM